MISQYGWDIIDDAIMGAMVCVGMVCTAAVACVWIWKR